MLSFCSLQLVLVVLSLICIPVYIATGANTDVNVIGLQLVLCVVVLASYPVPISIPTPSRAKVGMEIRTGYEAMVVVCCSLMTLTLSAVSTLVCLLWLVACCTRDRQTDSQTDRRSTLCLVCVLLESLENDDYTSPAVTLTVTYL